MGEIVLREIGFLKFKKCVYNLLPNLPLVCKSVIIGFSWVLPQYPHEGNPSMCIVSAVIPLTSRAYANNVFNSEKLLKLCAFK